MRSPSPQQKSPEQTSQTDFRRNQAERDLRTLKVQQRVSGCFRSDLGATAFARLRTYLATLRKQGQALLAALQTVFAGQPRSPEFA